MMKSFTGGTKEFLQRRHLQYEAIYGDAASVYEAVGRRRREAEDAELTRVIDSWSARVMTVAAGSHMPPLMQSPEAGAVVGWHLRAAQLALEPLAPSPGLLDEALEILEKVLNQLEAEVEPAPLFSWCVGEALAGLVKWTRDRGLETAGDGTPPVVPLCYTRILWSLQQAILPFTYPAMARVINLEAVNRDPKPFQEISDALFKLHENLLLDTQGRVDEALCELQTAADSSVGSGSTDPNPESAWEMGPSDRPPICVCAHWAQRSREEILAVKLRCRRRRPPLAIPRNGLRGLELHGPSPLKRSWTP